jgi:tetratricopeptide (TPR) repeat protein
MAIQERTKQDIQNKLAKMGDYVRIDYLNRALGSGLDFETRKFVLLELSRLYESRSMYLEAGKLMKNAAEINTTFKGKIGDFMKSVELLVRGGNYTEADQIFAQTLALATDRERPELKVLLKGYYFVQARAFTKADKRTQAKRSYEKLLTLELNPQEKKEAQDQLLALYQKLGNIKEFYKLRDGNVSGHNNLTRY